MSLLNFETVSDILPILLVPLIFLAVFIVIIVLVVKRAKSEHRKQEINKGQAEAAFTDGNGRTEHQRDYLNGKRRELAERKIAASDGSHEHVGGKVERYDKIVGSLGEVDDEGCDELDGVRLIEHDEAYCDDPDHLMPADNTDIQKAIVLGEVLNTPRFKQLYRRK